MYGAFFVHNDSGEKKVKYISFAKTHNTNGGFKIQISDWRYCLACIKSKNGFKFSNQKRYSWEAIILKINGVTGMAKIGSG